MSCVICERPGRYNEGTRCGYHRVSNTGAPLFNRKDSVEDERCVELRIVVTSPSWRQALAELKQACERLSVYREPSEVSFTDRSVDGETDVTVSRYKSAAQENAK